MAGPPFPSTARVAPRIRERETLHRPYSARQESLGGRRPRTFDHWLFLPDPGPLTFVLGGNQYVPNVRIAHLG